MSVFIHVGLPKTGTSTIQRGYFSQHKDIEHIGVNKNNPPKLERNFIDAIVDVECYEWRSRKKTIEEYRDIILKKDGCTVISAESFSTGTARSGKVDRYTIAKRLSGLFPDSSIILVLRNQLDIIRSAFIQSLEPLGVPNKGRRFSNYISRGKFNGNIQKEFENWVNELLEYDNQITTELRYYNYHDLVEIYNGLFDNFHILLFEKLVDDIEEFINELSIKIGVNSKPDLVADSTKNTRSTTTNLWWSKIAGQFPQIVEIKNLFPRCVIETVKNSGEELNVDYTSKHKSEIQSYYSEGNKILQDTTGLNIDRYGYTC
jgi:hypothetical protein